MNNIQNFRLTGNLSEKNIALLLKLRKIGIKKKLLFPRDEKFIFDMIKNEQL